MYAVQANEHSLCQQTVYGTMKLTQCNYSLFKHYCGYMHVRYSYTTCFIIMVDRVNLAQLLQYECYVYTSKMLAICTSIVGHTVDCMLTS